MTTELVPFDAMKGMAKAIADSKLFGLTTETQVLALMAVAQAEGKHPAIVARDYDIIQGRPAKKAEAMLRDFFLAGGKVEWLSLTDEKCEAKFSHAQGGEATISWDMKRAQAAGLASKDMFKKYPRQMLRARVVSEGVRTVWPIATSGAYVPEEVATFEPRGITVDPRGDIKPMDFDKRNNVCHAMKDLLNRDQSKLNKADAANLCLQMLDIWEELTQDEQIQVHDGFNVKQKEKIRHLETLDRGTLEKAIEEELSKMPQASAQADLV